jgi:putative ABC transport system ATP-binding protein
MHDLPRETAPLLEAVNLTKVYPRGREEVRALDGLSLCVEAGEFLAIVGPSGAGKTTLLSLLGCMDTPTAGRLRLAGRDVHALSERERTRLRGEELGFVFQHFSLIPTLTVEENVALPSLFVGRRPTGRARELLEKVGMGHRRRHRPHELSGGEMQRVAIARALINGPRLLLADEPTGNLDTATGEAVIRLFRELNEDGLTLIVVTHNTSLAAAARRQVELRDGKPVLAPEGEPSTPIHPAIGGR